MSPHQPRRYTPPIGSTSTTSHERDPHNRFGCHHTVSNRGKIRSIFFVAHSIYNVVGVVRIGRADKRFAFNVVVFAFYAYVYVRAPCGSCVAVGNTS